MLEHMGSIVDEVKKIESQVVEISRLQELFTEKVLEQVIDPINGNMSITLCNILG